MHTHSDALLPRLGSTCFDVFFQGKVLYRVRWLGYDSSWDTWEPAENLDTCDDLIEKYIKERKEKQKKKNKVSFLNITY